MRLADHAAYTPVTTSDTLTSILLDIPRPLKRPRIMAARLKLDQKNLDAELASLDPKLRVKRSNIIEDREVIGIGGYGVVTRGLLTAEGISLHGNLNDGKVAVKKLPVDPSKDLRVAIRLIREVKIWAQLDHPNILKFLGFYLSPNLDEILIISPWEPRGNINKYIMDTKPDMPKRLRMLSDVAEGLAYLHAFKPTVCHGDIKGGEKTVMGDEMNRVKSVSQPSIPAVRNDLDAELASLDPKLLINRRNVMESPEVIGQGGFGSVTIGTLTAEGISLYGNLNGGKVAVKKPLNDPNRDLRFAISLIREVKIWAQLDHPNILKFLGFYLSPDLDEILIISPWEPRGNINKYIVDTRPDMPKRLNLLSDVAEGLAYLHAFKPTVYHGDVKGDNVLVNGSDRALLCDFGLTTFQGGLETSHGFQGSVRWCSPELFSDKPRTTASDMWAFGCLVVEVIYESIPYPRARSNNTVVGSIVRGELPAQSKNLRQQSGVDLWDLLDECWQFEPAKRPSAEKCVNSLRLAVSRADYEIVLISGH
ncbi:hypothetical protein FRB94_011041 [Tulasnella sp. JGI-2019a]|nr:hypothetical protein FRB94_011041 [Tulasnella sp. JGI-2019a]